MIIQRIFSIPTDELLLVFLAYSKPLRDFCGFTQVPDASKTTRFKQDFKEDLMAVFDNLVNLTEPVCQAIDSEKACMTIFDSSGIEPFVTEIFLIHTLKLKSKKNPILLMRINPTMMQDCLSRH